MKKFLTFHIFFRSATKSSAIFFLIAMSFFLGSKSAKALTISPARLELTGDPGSVISSELLLMNDQKESKRFYSSAENFEAQGEGGVPNFVAGTEGLSTWVNTSGEITLAPGEQRKVPFTITIPASAEPGGHFAAIFWSTTPSQGQGGQLAVGAKIGTLVLLRVSGDVKEEAGLVEFTSLNNQRWFDSVPVTFVFRLRNGGGDRLKPAGTITITSMLGQKVAELSANPAENNVLPASIRRFEVVWPQEFAGNLNRPAGYWQTVKHQWNHFAFGLYTAKLDLKWGVESVEQMMATQRVLLVPWQLLTLCVLIIALILIGGRVGIRRYNAWIIARARDSRH
ncbi:MAG: hypothetical protein EXS55_00100 [Candidatus Magasanikbacteria bacterium]|nr:hypothetical protein [Candidatus Magasanikbacteria bacterium]